MKVFLMDLGLDVWLLLVYGKKNEYNIKSMKIILSGLCKSYFDKLINCGTTKETCDKFQCIYDEYGHKEYEVKKYSQKEKVHKESNNIKYHECSGDELNKNKA